MARIGYTPPPAAGGGDPTMGGDLSGTASNAQIVAGAVDTAELAASAVTNPKITSVVATKVTGTYPAISFATGSGNGITIGTSTLYEGASGVFYFPNELRRVSPDTNGQVVSSQITGEPQLRFTVAAWGYMSWGPGSANADTDLYRSAAGTLHLDSHLEFADPGNISVGTTTGTKIGTGTTQKLGFWNKAPVVQPAAVANVATANAAAIYTASEQELLNELKTQMNALLARLREPGIIAT